MTWRSRVTKFNLQIHKKKEKKKKTLNNKRRVWTGGKIVVSGSGYNLESWIYIYIYIFVMSCTTVSLVAVAGKTYAIDR